MHLSDFAIKALAALPEEHVLASVQATLNIEDIEATYKLALIELTLNMYYWARAQVREKDEE